ncbi:MAG: type II secretion system protein [Opitutaceae bacterium]|nr:type II secretion system protein [Opitutaceae bacterium]
MQQYPVTARSPQEGFTLVELLAVIAIIAVLASIIIVSIGKARNMAYQSKCLASLRSTYTAAQLYAADNKGAVVPGSTETQGVANSDELWSVKLVPYYSQVNNAASATFACPKWEDDRVTVSAYNWGYAMNLTPGYEGASSTAQQRATSIITHRTDGTTTGTLFRFNAITHPAKRLFFCDSNEWHVRGQQVVTGTPGQTLASYNRHGENRNNVIYFDGHVAALTPAEVDKAIYDPAR